MLEEWSRDRAAADEAGFALLLLADRISALADVEWRSPAAVLYRTCIARLSADCDALSTRLAAYIPAQP